MEEDKSNTQNISELIRAITGLILVIVALWNFTKPTVSILNAVPSMLVHTSTVTVGGVEFNIETNLAVAPSEEVLAAVAALTHKDIDELLSHPGGFSSNSPEYYPTKYYENLVLVGLWGDERTDSKFSIEVTPLGKEARSFLLRTLFYVTDTL